MIGIRIPIVYDILRLKEIFKVNFYDRFIPEGKDKR